MSSFSILCHRESKLLFLNTLNCCVASVSLLPYETTILLSTRYQLPGAKERLYCSLPSPSQPFELCCCCRSLSRNFFRATSCRNVASPFACIVSAD